MSDTRLQELYAQAMGRRSGATAAGCVTPEQLLQLALREGPEADRLTLLDHVMGCPDCQRELDLLRAVESAGRQITRDRPVRSIGRRVPLALAASMLILVGAGLLIRNRSAGDTLRGGGGQLTLLSPPTDVPPGR